MTAPRRRAVVGVALATLLSGAFAGVPGPTATSIAITGHGGVPDGSAFAPVALSPDSFLVGAMGLDGVSTTADDEVLLVTGLGGNPVLTAIPTPFRSGYSGSIVRMSATRALVATRGPDGLERTADDTILLLDRLGSGNTVTPLTVGAIKLIDGQAPVRLDASTAVVVTQGPDKAAKTADDTVAILSDLGGANTVTQVAAPRVADFGVARPIALSPTSFLVTSLGPDALVGNADDVVYLFTGVGSNPVRTDLAVPNIENTGCCRPVRLSATSALLTTGGPDSALSTDDDTVVILSGLGTTNTVTPFSVGPLFDYSNGRPLVLDAATAVVGSNGPDRVDKTADDRLAILTGLDTASPTATYVTVGAMDEDFGSRANLIGPRTVACATGGPNLTFGNSDDTLAIVSDVGGANTLVQVPNPAMTTYNPARPDGIPGVGFAVVSGGADNLIATTDDELRIYSQDGGGNWTHLSLPGLGALDNQPAAPVVLGGGRLVFVSAGTNNTDGNGDDLIRLVTGIEGMEGVLLDKASLRWNDAKPEKGEKLSASGRYSTGLAEFLRGNDVTVSLGNAAQTLAAGDLIEKKPGKFQYADKKGLRGWLRGLKIDTVKGKFSVKGAGVGTGAETTDAGMVVVSFDPHVERDSGFADAVAATSSSKGISWKRPKE